MISLINKTKRPEVINLPHAEHCGDGEDKCVCKDHEHRELVHDRRTGEVRIRVHKQRISPSIHLLPGIPSGPLPESVLEVDRVKELLAKRQLAKTEVSAVPEAAVGAESTN